MTVSLDHTPPLADVAEPTPLNTPDRPRSYDKRLNGVALVLALLLLWEVSARLGWVVSSYWPPVSTTFLAALQGLAGGEVLMMLLATLRRAAIGYACGP